MATQIKPKTEPLGWKQSFLWLGLAVVCFHAAYTLLKYPPAGLLIFGYAYGFVKLTDQANVRRAFYFGLATSFLCYAPQLFFFFRIFNVAAIVLWLVLAFWVGLFAAIVCACVRRWGKVKTAWLIPIIWTGLEYFRSELYFLKFSWLNIGYALPNFPPSPLHTWGMFGMGFLTFLITAIACQKNLLKRFWVNIFGIFLIFLIPLVLLFMSRAAVKAERPFGPFKIVGVQMEFPSEDILPKILTLALAKNTNAPIFVLSEYTLDGGVPDSLKNWCREHSRYLVVGGKEFVTNDVYYNTAFVIGTNGDIVFKQVKCVPIQFFHDGLPGLKQEVWNSPWGKIGICICYDLSYTRVTDELVRQGAQLIICPTMDVEFWGRHQHELHARVAPVRAAEYGIPIFRVASSGISQAVTGGGQVVAQTKAFSYGEIFSARLRLPRSGSLPLDRYLAPLCTIITAFILVTLLFLSWNESRRKICVPSV